MNSDTLKIASRDKWWSVVCIAESLSRLHVLDFHIPGTELTLPPHHPCSPFLHLQHLNAVLYAKSLSCILNTSFNTILTHHMNKIHSRIDLISFHPPPQPVSILLKLKFPSITCCQTCHSDAAAASGSAGSHSSSLDAFCRQGEVLHESQSLLLRSAPISSPSAFLDYWWNSLVQFGCLIDKARTKKKKKKEKI